MKFSQALLHEKTLPAVKISTTFNTPGNYVPPYGKTSVKVGGRGASGNNTAPGNYVPGNYVPGNVAGYNLYHYNYSFTTTYNDGYYSTHGSPFHNSGGPGAFNSAQSPYTANSVCCCPVNGTPTHVTTQVTYSFICGGNPNYNCGYYNAGYNNPSSPGNPGSNYCISGVSFPGGAAASLAPVVSPTATAIKYGPSPISITVPPGGYVVVCNS